MFKIVFIIFFVLIENLCFGQESMYSLSTGISIIDSNATLYPNNAFGGIDGDIEINSIPMELSWFSGRQDFGGLFIKLQVPLILLSKDSKKDAKSRISSFEYLKSSIGFHFSYSILSRAIVKLGPELSLIIGKGWYSNEKENDTFIIVTEPCIGIDGEFDWLISTEDGGNQGLYTLIGISLSNVGFDFSKYSILPRFGFGLSL